MHSKAVSLAIASLAAGLLVSTSGAVHAGEVTHTTTIGGLTLPEHIGPLEFIGEHSGPEGERSLSYSYRAVGLALEISVTDLGPDGIADGIDAPELLERYREAKQDVVAATHVRRLKPREAKVSLGEARVAREALFTVARKKNGIGGATYLIFTAAHGLLVDARLDVAPGLEEDGALSHGEVLEALGAAIPATDEPVKQARAHVAAEAAAQEKVAIMWDPATPEQEKTIWLAYLFARAAYVAGESGEAPTAGEREASFEEEVRGRTTAVNMYRALKHIDAQLASAYFSDIDRVEAAGFLREYVWSYLHQASWKTLPAGLNLEAFDAWRATHLTNHVPVTHGRIAFRLAAKAATPAGS
ncbi:MAG TPA: hypothetical protein VFS52_12555 [Steroidobacteraceae bacterium]|nr:hypothetical protein [Steroidobacteraceae bacterium]